MPAPRTGGTGSGSLLLPSPRKNKWGEPDSHGRKLSEVLALTPTGKGNMLAPAMQRQWPGARNMAALLPTPAAQKGPRKGGMELGGGGAGARAKVRRLTEMGLLPTPRKCDNYRSPSSVAKGLGAGPEWEGLLPSLGTMVRQGMLPTPTAADVKGPNPLERRPPCDDDLPTRVLRLGMMPSPQARDWKSSAWTPETMAKNSRPLNETARQRGIAGTAASLLVLVEWMMGYPAGWLARALPPSAMPSSRKSPKP